MSLQAVNVNLTRTSHYVPVLNRTSPLLSSHNFKQSRVSSRDAYSGLLAKFELEMSGKA